MQQFSKTDSNNSNNLTDAQKAELDRRYELHKQGKSNSYTWEEVKQIVRGSNSTHTSRDPKIWQGRK